MKTLRFDRGEKPMQAHEQAALVEVERLFSSAPWKQPLRGFSGRWLARVQADSQRSQRTRASWLAVGNGALALVVLVLMYSTALTSPVSFVTAAIDDLMSVFSLLFAAIQVIGSIFSALPVVTWFPFFGAVLLLSSLWVFLFRRPVDVEGEVR